MKMKEKVYTMNNLNSVILGLLATAVASAMPLHAAIDGSLDPDCVVAGWSNESAYPKVIDINFSDTSWPDTWSGETARDCPEYADGSYVNAILNVNANGSAEVRYPVMFHNCTFATKASYNGYAGTTAAFGRQYYLGESPVGSGSYINNWQATGHTSYLEDNIRYDDSGSPVYGEAGFVQMCRSAAITDASGNQESVHGWMEIDHIPYVDRIQWSWSSTSWGRGIKCDIKIGDGEWNPLVWMGSEKQKQGWTSFSDQGYFMENIIGASDVSLRWRVWDGEDMDNPVQALADGTTVFTQAINPFAMMQAPRVHKIQIFGEQITVEQADFARNNPIGDPGTLTDLSQFGIKDPDAQPSPDAEAQVEFYVVDRNGNGDYTSVQAAIDAVSEGARGIIYILPGEYDENIYAGRKGEATKFISLIGENAETTILTSGVDRGGSNAGNSYLDCSALNVFAPCFYAENLTIRNTAGNVGQAEALYTSGDAHVFKNCIISGHQDTYKANVGARGYFSGCRIEGTVDFIYDGGLEWFENCDIVCLKGGGYIAAPAESGMPMTRVMYPLLSENVFYAGLFFNNCNVTAESGVGRGTFSLGRPWKETSGAMFMRCKLGEHISDAGWTAWGGNENSSSLYEYGNVDASGNPLSTSGRASFSRQASHEEVAEYFNPGSLFGNFSKVSFDFESVLSAPAKPDNFAFYGGRLIWDDVKDAAGYLVCKDGEFHGLVTVPVVEDADEEAAYTVRSVSRTGAVSEAAEAVEKIRLTAFPTAEGFGKYASGGRGGKVVKVTSLADDDSDGTLRKAFEQYPGEPITILFEVSGEIALTRELRVSRSDWTLAGQTAPGEGIVITHNKVNLGGSQNFIVRNVRFRIGQKSVDGNILAENALGAENCMNFIFDHCSFGWSVEENMNTADSHFLTVQYSIVHEGLYDAGHSKGARGYGCQWGGSPATYHHNLLAHNNSRSCRFNGARGEDQVVFIEYVNNVNYNFGGTGGCYGGENTASIASYNGKNSAHECNFINNYYRRGPGSSTSAPVFVNVSYAREGATSWGPSKWYVNGNVIHGLNGPSINNWNAMTVETYQLADIRVDERIVPENAYYKYSMAGSVGNYVPDRYMLEGFETATDAFETVIAKAGTVNRDKVESRVAADARDGVITYGGTGRGVKTGIIDTENDAEGFFAYSTDYQVPVDTDGDGMPDEWEKAVGLDANVADNNRLNSDGYTALEVYLCSLMGESLGIDFVESGITPVTVETVEVAYDRAAATLYVGEQAVGGILTVYALDGAVLMRQRIASTSFSLAHLCHGVLIVRVESTSIAPRLLKLLR